MTGKSSRIIPRTKALVRLMAGKVKKIVRFVTVGIWNIHLEDLSRWKARLVKDLQTILVMMNTFSQQKMGFQITALAYQCTMALVPMLAIAFFLTSGVGLSDQLEMFLYERISDTNLIDTLMNAANNIIGTAQSGLFGLISMLTFVWIVLWMMISVVRVFNNAWKVDRPRPFFKQLGVVILILVLSPFVILLFFSGSIVYSNVLDLVIPKFEFSENIKSFLGWLVFAAVAVFIISMMYKYIPNCKVRYRHALKAAMFAGVAFTVLQYLYLETQVMVAKQSAVYGVLAAIPLFMIWLNLGWTIIIYGAELSYGFQYVEEKQVTSEDLGNQIRDNKEKRKEKRRRNAGDILQI